VGLAKFIDDLKDYTREEDEMATDPNEMPDLSLTFKPDKLKQNSRKCV
jgi:hypothetical protein